MKARTWQTVAVLLSLVVLTNLLGVGQDSGVAPLGIIPTPPESSELEVRIWVDKGAYELGESITVHYSLNQPAYVYIWDILPDGTANQILPNATSGGQDNYKTAGDHTLTGTIEPPTGTEYLQILASTTPIDPFAYWSGDPGAFIQQLQVQILGIVPEAQRSWDFTSFEIISGSSPAYGTVTVNSTPSGASIWVDGSYVGYTPRTFYLTPGYHQIAVSKTGYSTWSRSFFGFGSFNKTYNVTLTPLGPVNQDPNAAFTFTPANPQINEWVPFDASGSSDPDGSIVSYNWSFGDGSTDSGATAFHRFGAPGTYVVTLTVTDNDGATDSATQAVQVGSANLPPTAAFAFTPTNPAVNGWIQFNGSASVDSDGSITSYAWSFGDGSTDSGAIAWHRFSLPGTYTITLTVTDNDGASDSVSQTLQIGGVNLPPTAALSFTPTNPAVNGWVQFNGSASTDPDGSIASYAWNFGDGSTDSGSTVWHRFTLPGTYTVTLTVSDNDGAHDSISQTIVVGGATNLLPNAAFSFTPPAPGIGEWIRFDGRSSSDADGTITTYAWSFGDGTPSAVGSVVYHQFPGAGSYIVSLTVTDNGGATDTTTQSLAIGQSQQSPVAAFSYSPLSPVVGEPVLFNGQASYDPDGVIATYAWDLDGNGVDDITGPNPIVQIVYQNVGAALVRLTVTDNSGLSATTTQPVVVSTQGGTPGVPPMGSTAGIFVWGTDRWHLTVNAGAGWITPRNYRLEVRTDDAFTDVDQGSSSGVAPMGIVPTPTDGGKTLVFEGSLQTGNVDYSFRAPESSSIWMKLQMDIDGDGQLETSTSFVGLRYSMVHPPTSPFTVGLPNGSTAELTPSIDFRIGNAITYTETTRFVFWSTTISELESP